MTTIHTTPVTHGTCEFCAAPAVWHSQLVDASGAPLRVAVLACWRHKTHGRLLAEVAQVLDAAAREEGEE